MIRATFVLLVAHAVIPRLRRSSAAGRHVFWTMAIAMAAILPALAPFVPAWHPIAATRLMEALPVSLATLSAWVLPRQPDVIVRATQIESGASAPVDWIVAPCSGEKAPALPAGTSHLRVSFNSVCTGTPATVTC